MADLDLRKLRYFLAVADHLHFGRAATELHIAQPVLSRQIQALEQELKVDLFVRDRRTTALTAAGRQLLADTRPLLASADAVRRRAIRAARDRATFTVGFMPGLLVTAAVRAMSAQRPELSIEVLRTGWADQVDVLRDGRVDVGYLRLPFDHRGLRSEPLSSEPMVVALPADHRLAGKRSVHLSDLAGEHLLQDPDAVPEWAGVADEMRRAGRRDVPVLGTVEEKLEHVAAGNGIVVLPLSTATFYTRPGIAYATVDDLPSNQVSVAWDATRRTPLIAEFVAIALAHRGSVAGSGAEPGELGDQVG